MRSNHLQTCYVALSLGLNLSWPTVSISGVQIKAGVCYHSWPLENFSRKLALVAFYLFYEEKIWFKVCG